MMNDFADSEAVEFLPYSFVDCVAHSRESRIGTLRL